MIGNRAKRAGKVVAASALALGAALTPAATATASSAAPEFVEITGDCKGAMSTPYGVWVEQAAGTGVAGHPGYRKGYHIQRGSGNVMVSIQVKGFNEQNQLTWYGVGALSDNTPILTPEVPWGNALATPAVRAYNVGPGLVGTVEFTC